MKQYIKSILTSILTTTVATTAIVGGMCALNHDSQTNPGIISAISELSSNTSQMQTSKSARHKSTTQNRIASNSNASLDMSQPTFQSSKKHVASATTSTTFVVATTPVSGSKLNTNVSKNGSQSTSSNSTGVGSSSILYASSRVPHSSMSAGHSVSLQEPFSDERPTNRPHTKVDLDGGKDEPFYESLDDDLLCLSICCAFSVLFIGFRRRKIRNQI